MALTFKETVLGCVILNAAFLSALLSLDTAEGQQRAPHFRVGVDVVTVRVAVSDPLNRFVVGLEREHFQIFENKVEQPITHFSNEKSPVKVGVILDVSGSMEINILAARNSVVRFVERGDPGDEFFLITFNDRARMVQDFTSSSEDIQNKVAVSTVTGRTALYDAVYAGLEKLRPVEHGKKALIIITDGEDNSSRYSFTELKEFAQESDTQIYLIGERGELGYGRWIIAELGRLTGGRAFFPQSFDQLDYFVDLIHAELHNQYVLGYTPTDRNFHGEWREIQIRLQAPEGLPRLHVRAKEGYYAPNRAHTPPGRSRDPAYTRSDDDGAGVEPELARLNSQDWRK